MKYWWHRLLCLLGVHHGVGYVYTRMQEGSTRAETVWVNHCMWCGKLGEDEVTPFELESPWESPW
jgi:hypothetical protein